MPPMPSPARYLAVAQREAQAKIPRLCSPGASASPLLHDGALTHYAPADGVYAFRHAGTRWTGPSVMVALNRTDAAGDGPACSFRRRSSALDAGVMAARA